MLDNVQKESDFYTECDKFPSDCVSTLAKKLSVNDTLTEIQS